MWELCGRHDPFYPPFVYLDASSTVTSASHLVPINTENKRPSWPWRTRGNDFVVLRKISHISACTCASHKCFASRFSLSLVLTEDIHELPSRSWGFFESVRDDNQIFQEQINNVLTLEITRKFHGVRKNCFRLKSSKNFLSKMLSLQNIVSSNFQLFRGQRHVKTKWWIPFVLGSKWTV